MWNSDIYVEILYELNVQNFLKMVLQNLVQDWSLNMIVFKQNKSSELATDRQRSGGDRIERKLIGIGNEIFSTEP